MSSASQQKAVSVPWIRAQKGQSKLTMLTAYDFPTAELLDAAGIDLLLVGDSLATVVYGEPNTLSISVDDMLRHCRAVAKAAKRALVVADMPFMSYHVSVEQALSNASRFLKEAGAQAIKLEGGADFAPTVKALTRASIPVVAHIGLMPQSLHAAGPYRMHGRSEAERLRLKEDALALEEAGAFAIVLECVEELLAKEICQLLRIPGIGIGSGPHCDGQVLVTEDLVGLSSGHVPRFVHPLAALREPFRQAVVAYIERTQGV